MNLATLRIEGSEEALRHVRSELDLVADATWKQGDHRLDGVRQSSDGLTSMIVDAENPAGLISGIRDFLDKCEKRNIGLGDSNVSTELSIGITVGDSDQFVASLNFSASDLRALGRLGASLSIAAYPASDEADQDSR